MVKNNISLDVAKNGTQATVYVNQDEVESRSLVVSLHNNGKKLELPDNYYVTAFADINGSIYSNEASIENDKILFTFPSSYFDKAGKFELQIRIQRENNGKSYVLYSPKIQVIVSRSIYNSEAITGTTEYDRFAYDIQRMLTSQIDSIEETVEDKKHTYTVKFKAGNSQTFVVYDGKDGKSGKNGKDAEEGIKKIIYNDVELPVTDDKTVSFSAQPVMNELAFINSQEDVDKMQPDKLYLVKQKVNIGSRSYSSGALVYNRYDQYGDWIMGIADNGFVVNDELLPLWSEIQDNIKIVKTLSGYELVLGSAKKKIDFPKTSELENDSNFVSDENYVHTDNNFTKEEKKKLGSLANYDDTAIKKQISNKQDKLSKEQLENISAVPNKIDNSAVGNGLKFADGMLQLDIPVASASTTYGGDAQ